MIGNLLMSERGPGGPQDRPPHIVRVFRLFGDELSRSRRACSRWLHRDPTIPFCSATLAKRNRPMSKPPSHRLLPQGMRITYLCANDAGWVLNVEPEADCARCSMCGSRSERVHSRYTRTASDLPWRGIAVTMKVRARTFFCDRPSCERRIFCERKIFAERLAEVAHVHARSTDRQREALEWIALALGGEAGARLARELGLLVSPDTLLSPTAALVR